MRSLPAAVTALAALAVAATAQGSAFTAPRTLADWGPGGEVLVAAPGAAAWTHPTGVRISRGGGVPERVPGAGLVQDVSLASAGGEPVAAWVDSEMRLHTFTGRESIVAGTMERVRKVAATPSALAWIGVGPGGSAGSRSLRAGATAPSVPPARRSSSAARHSASRRRATASAPSPSGRHRTRTYGASS